MAFGHLFKNIPNFRCLTLNEFLGAANGVHIAKFFEAADNEWLEKNERHLFGKSALIEFEFRTDDDNRAARIVHAFTEEVLAETTTLTLQHVAERLERTVRSTSYGATMATIIEEGIHRLLEHALFVADDDFRRFELQQGAETVVAVDDAAVEIIEIGSGETATFERDERTEIRRNNRKHIENHPLRAGIRLCEALNKFQAFREFFAQLFTAGRAHGLLDFLLDGSEVHGGKNLLDRFCAHASGEFFAVLFLGVAEFRLREELALFKRSAAWIDNNKVLVINDTLQSTGGHVQHEPQAGWHALVEPNV